MQPRYIRTMGDHPARPPRILATGFSIFPGAPENPTSWAIAEVARAGWNPNGAILVTRTLPVRYDIWSELHTLLEREDPDAVVGFGLSAKATGFTLEETARNQLGLGRPDAAGTVASSAQLETDGPAAMQSRLPLPEIESALIRAALPVSRSEDAGDYVCNLFFYHLMKHCTEHGRPHLGGFVHVPYLDEQLPRLERAGLPTGHLKTLTQRQLLLGVQTVIGVVAEALLSAVRGR
jgi:pyroglutamyl-peptidase